MRDADREAAREPDRNARHHLHAQRRHALKLTVADLLARRAALEIAYNPNDCVELRWGAAEGSPEAATCKRHLPPEQKTKMGEYRAWFHDARRPSR